MIVHHATLAFGGGGSWAVSDPNKVGITSIILTAFTAVNQSYFMAAFFLLAGYFTPRSLEKKGSGPFLIDRLIRLGIPLLVYSTLIWNINVRSEKSSVVIAVASSKIRRWMRRHYN